MSGRLYLDCEDWQDAQAARSLHEIAQAAIRRDELNPPPEPQRASPTANRPSPRACTQCGHDFIPDFQSAGHDACLWCRTTGGS